VFIYTSGWTGLATNALSCTQDYEPSAANDEAEQTLLRLRSYPAALAMVTTDKRMELSYTTTLTFSHRRGVAKRNSSVGKAKRLNPLKMERSNMYKDTPTAGTKVPGKNEDPRPP
jgi:hypothetical protein